MKYPTHLVLAGSIVEDKEWTDRLEEALQEAELACEQYKATVTDEMVILSERMTKALDKINNGTTLTVEQVTKITERKEGSYRNSVLGLNNNVKLELEKKVRRAKEELEAHLVHRDGKSNFTRFLETVQEDTVSDYGLKSAGFGDNLRLGLLVLKGKDALNAAAKEN